MNPTVLQPSCDVHTVIFLRSIYNRREASQVWNSGLSSLLVQLVLFRVLFINLWLSKVQCMCASVCESPKMTTRVLWIIICTESSECEFQMLRSQIKPLINTWAECERQTCQHDKVGLSTSTHLFSSCFIADQHRMNQICRFRPCSSKLLTCVVILNHIFITGLLLIHNTFIDSWLECACILSAHVNQSSIHW